MGIYDWRKEFPKAEMPDAPSFWQPPMSETEREERAWAPVLLRAIGRRLLGLAVIAVAAVLGWYLRGIV